MLAPIEFGICASSDFLLRLYGAVLITLSLRFSKNRANDALRACGIADGIMVVALTTFGVTTLQADVVGVGPLDVLAAINSSLLLEPLPGCGPVCEETDKGLEIPEQGGMYTGGLIGKPSSPDANFELDA